MWIEDLTKALYYLNSLESKYYILIQKIENNIIYLTSGAKLSVFSCGIAYNNMLIGNNTDFNDLLIK